MFSVVGIIITMIALSSCAPAPHKCVKHELIYRIQYDGQQWRYYPESACTQYE